MPRGITYMKTIKKMPYIAQGAAFEISCAQFGTNWMKSAPKIAPEMDASPPMTIPTRNVIDRNTLNASGATKARSEEHTSELQSLTNLVCRLLLEKKKKK